MAATNPTGKNIKDGSIQRVDLDDGLVSAVSGVAVIKKAIAGTGISLSSTGFDAGTGDVTINVGSTVVLASRATFSNADYTAAATDRYIATTTTALTAPHTVTLPAANAVSAGTLLTISDDGGVVTSANYIAIARKGTDTIMGQTGNLGIYYTRGSMVLSSDGVSNWSIVLVDPSQWTYWKTSGTSFTLTIGTRALLVECFGGGGGGGGATAAASACSVGAGGGGGGYAAIYLATGLKASYSYVVGAAGAAGAAANGVGGNGGDTTWDSPSICTAGGGVGGAGGASGTIAALSGGGGGGGSGSVGSVLMGGSRGGNAQRMSGVYGLAGYGGSAAMGGGSAAIIQSTTNVNGAAGANYGGGGSGAVSVNTTGQTGGPGAAGLIRITEYY